MPEEITWIALGQSVLFAVIILAIGWMVSKWANLVIMSVARGRQLDEALSRFMASIAQYAILAAALITSLGAVGVETTSLVAIFASAGLAIGLALQGSLANFASGVMILFFRPFNLGDLIDAGGHLGEVKDIGLFATTMHNPNNDKIIVPNSAITGSSIINHTALGTRRGSVDVGVAYGSDVGKAIEVLQAAANTTALVLDTPAPAVALVGLGASSVDFQVHCWCNSADYLGMMHNVRRALYEGLNEAGIDIPFNQIVVHQAE
ncbi:MAG: small conductance mechanosensitive channel [Myxococcota bacterium]|jgi:small conductance mechanosensitive channel